MFVTLKTHKYDGRAVVCERAADDAGAGGADDGRVPVRWENLGQTAIERSVKEKMPTANPKRIKSLRLRKAGSNKDSALPVFVCDTTEEFRQCALAQLNPETEVVLEIGCSTGMTTMGVVQKGYKKVI